MELYKYRDRSMAPISDKYVSDIKLNDGMVKSFNLPAFEGLL